MLEGIMGKINMFSCVCMM